MSDSGNEVIPRPAETDNNQNGLRDRIAAAIAKADQDWCSDNNLHHDMADAVIAALDRDYIIVEPGTPLAQRIAQWQLADWDGHWEGPPGE